MNLPLFDANGSFGLMSGSPTEYPSAADLLAHLDRLGVSRAVVWHASARNHHADTGNRLLLEAIAGHEERLVPAFTVGTDMLWSRNGLKELTAAMESRRVRALRLFPWPLKFTAGQIGPVIDALAAHQPVLFCDVREVSDPVTIPERFPQLPVVLTHMMWPQMPMLLDTMRRFPHVYADISWLHSTGAIELLCRHFGASRVVFGLGAQVHQGASIAALAHAAISEADRALIAHGNLDRLLQLSPTPYLPAASRQPLWSKFVERQPLGLEILDAHGHIGASSVWMVEDQEPAVQITHALRDMNQCSIKTLFVSGHDALGGDPVAGNDLLATYLKPYGDRFRGWIVFNPRHAERLTPHLERWLADPFFAGFKIHSDLWRTPMTDPRFEIVWKTANTHQVPILFHTWDTPNSTPFHLRDICPQYPDAMFLLGHSGGGDRGRREAEEMVAKNPNVWLEWCGSFLCSIPWEETLSKVGKDRLLFGTDATCHSFYWELGRFLSQDLPDEMIRPALGDNLRGLLARRVNGARR